LKLSGSAGVTLGGGTLVDFYWDEIRLSKVSSEPMVEKGEEPWNSN